MKSSFFLYLSAMLSMALPFTLSAQDIHYHESATLESVKEEMQEDTYPLTMNDLGLDMGGYVLYQTTIVTDTVASLAVENVRDFAAVFIDGQYKGGLSDANKTLSLHLTQGEHTLMMYVENIGRITYGPEILDNSKGVWGEVTLDDTPLEDWSMTPLMIHDTDVQSLTFAPFTQPVLPCYFRGTVTVSQPKECHLDIRGWGMGEVWLNGEYLGNYWDENEMQSLLIPDDMLREGNNEFVVFELKRCAKPVMHIHDEAIFK